MKYTDLIPKKNKNLAIFYIILHSLYPIAIIIISIIGLMNNNESIQGIDYKVFDYSVDCFFNFDFENLYNRIEYVEGVTLFFRYFPLSPILYFPYIFFSQIAGYYLTIAIIYVSNIFNCLIVFKIAREYYNVTERDIRWIIHMLGFVLFLPFNAVLYYIGQNSSFVTLFILLAYYLFKKSDHKIRNNLLGGFLISFAILSKPVALLLIPFLVIINIEFNGNKKIKIHIERSSIFRLIPVVFIIGINILLFLLIPNLLTDFIYSNFGFREGTVWYNPASDSTVTFITRFLTIETLYPFLISCLSLTVILFLNFILKKDSEDKLIHYITLAMFITLITYPDIWLHYQQFVYIPMILSIQKIKNENNIESIILVKQFKYLLFFSAFGLLLAFIPYFIQDTYYFVLLPIYYPFLYYIYYRIVFKKEKKRE